MIETIFVGTISIFAGTMLLLLLGNKIFKWKWTCKAMGWHDGDGQSDRGFDGCSVHSVCIKCGKKVMQDSQGNWF